MSYDDGVIGLMPFGSSFRHGTLRSLREGDVIGMLEWMHDPSTAVVFARDFMSVTEYEALAFVRSSWEDTSSVNLAVAGEADEYLGTISLKNIDTGNFRAEYAIAMRACARGTGAAAGATRDLLGLAFGPLGLHSVYLNVRTDNVRAIRLYEKCGFVREGVSRDAIRGRGGVFVDLAWYSMLGSDLA